MSDDRPSIAELQRIDWNETVLLSPEAAALRSAAPALLAIIAAAQAYVARMNHETAGALLDALSKVDP